MHHYRAISRDPDLYPDPEAFNPLRWVKPEYPTYQEPLTQFPTIINSTQFGYGRRTCTGQQVADEDMLIGIGSIAWLFDIKKCAEDSAIPASVDSIQKGQTYGMNEKATISSEEINTGISTKEPTMEEKILAKYTYPGSESNSNPAPKKSKSEKSVYKPMEWGDVTQKPEDPTLDYSILLIAKPIPFRFDLTPRDSSRVSKVRAMFREGVDNGDYTESRQYWGENQGEGKPVGWGTV